MKTKHKVFLFILLLICVSFDITIVSCDPFIKKFYPIVKKILSVNSKSIDKDFPFGKSFNKERITRGIPVIPNNWKSDSVNRYQCNWSYLTDYYNTENKAFCGQHTLKTVEHKGDTIISETDTYIGFDKGLFVPKGDPCDRVTHYELIIITFNYEEERKGNYPWDFDIEMVNLKKLKCSLWRVDSILKNWGIARINYVPIDNMSLFKKYEKYEFNWEDMSDPYSSTDDCFN